MASSADRYLKKRKKQKQISYLRSGGSAASALVPAHLPSHSSLIEIPPYPSHSFMARSTTIGSPVVTRVRTLTEKAAAAKEAAEHSMVSEGAKKKKKQADTSKKKKTTTGDPQTPIDVDQVPPPTAGDEATPASEPSAKATAPVAPDVEMRLAGGADEDDEVDDSALVCVVSSVLRMN